MGLADSSAISTWEPGWMPSGFRLWLRVQGSYASPPTDRDRQTVLPGCLFDHHPNTSRKADDLPALANLPRGEKRQVRRRTDGSENEGLPVAEAGSRRTIRIHQNKLPTITCATHALSLCAMTRSQRTWCGKYRVIRA